MELRFKFFELCLQERAAYDRGVTTFVGANCVRPQTNFGRELVFFADLCYNNAMKGGAVIVIADGLTKNKDIMSFLMIGQSNMAGRGDFGEVKTIENPNCLMLRMGRWQRMSEPINPDRAVFGTKFHSGVSLGASFADKCAKHFKCNIGLIPCADGGTSISQGQPGEILFDHAVMMTELAMRSSNFAGILWHQGESDCNDTKFPYYKQSLIRMITELRKKLGAEDIPFIFGELSEHISDKWNAKDYPEKMNLVFKEIEKELPHCRLVSSKGLTLKSDGVHFDSVSLREFGNRYFDAYIDLVCTNK